jgi:ubiquinone biosynthesis protein
VLPLYRVRETYQDLRRYSQIATVFFRYGFGNLLDRLRARYYVSWPRRAIRGPKQLEQLSVPERLRLAFEELGPTFIKLAQILSSRPDVFPPDYIAEFGKLQDMVPPFPFDQAEALIEDQLGRPLAEIFLSIEESPVAAASLAQVHRAETRSGDHVAVKVQRPGIEALIATDIRILYDLAGLAERYVTESRYFGPQRVVDEFARTIRRELDFVREGRMMDRFRKSFTNDPTVYIPKVYWDFTATKVLTTEYISGIKIYELEPLEAAGLDRKTIAVNGAHLILKEVFDYHLFHADPHPGNLFVLPNNVIAPVDFGMTGTLSQDVAEHMASIFVAVVDRDAGRLIKVLSRLGWLAPEAGDSRGLREDLEELIERYYGIPLQKVKIKGLFEELMDIIRRYGLHLPTDLVLMAKALLISEGVGRMLYPDFNIIEHAKPYAKRLLVQRLDPIRHLRRLSEWAEDSKALIKASPSDVKAILSKMAKGQFAIEFEHRGLENFVGELDRSSNRLSFAIVIASLIIGSSLIFQTGVGPTMFGYPIIGLIGFLMASIFGIWLLIGIIKSGRL